MSQPGQDQADITATTIEALRANAQRLGLIWNRRMAEVNDGTDPAAVMATFDGDAEPVPMVSMIGMVSAGQRVYVDIVPPGANFIVGRPGGYRSRQLLAATVASVTFSGIPSTMTGLRLRWRARIDAAVNLQFIGARYNSDASAVYSWHYTQGLNATASAAPFSAQTYAMIGFCTGASAPANVYGSGVANFIGWDIALNPSFNHYSEALGTGVANFASTNGGGVMAATGTWTSLQVVPASGSFVAGSSFELIGELP